MFEAAGASRVWRKVETLVREWRPERLVVGLPLAMDGSEHDMTRRARRFARRLEARFRLPVELADERLSSAAAEETFREAASAPASASRRSTPSPLKSSCRAT